MIAITGASGKTGSKAAELLFSGADAVYLLVPPELEDIFIDVFVPVYKSAA